MILPLQRIAVVLEPQRILHYSLLHLLYLLLLLLHLRVPLGSFFLEALQSALFLLQAEPEILKI